MNIIRDIIADYEKLIKTNIQIPLSNGDTIKFAFNPQDLPHLLGLQYLVDNPILFEYKEKRISATDLYNRMCSDGEDAIDIDDFENSEHFDEIYKGRIQYFSSEMILDIIQSRQIVKFDYTKVKNFQPNWTKSSTCSGRNIRMKTIIMDILGLGLCHPEKVVISIILIHFSFVWMMNTFVIKKGYCPIHS